MTTTVDQILAPARRVLSDVDATRWDDDDLVEWLNHGIRATIDLKPSANVAPVTFALAPGSIQALPDEVAALIKVQSLNLGGTLPVSVTPVDKERLESEDPDWMAATENEQAVHYVVDPETPKFLWLYPPQPVGTSSTMTILAAVYPDRVRSGQDLPIHDRYSSALIDYIISRAFMRDAAEGTSNPRVRDHYTLFMEAILGKEAVMKRLRAEEASPP